MDSTTVASALERGITSQCDLIISLSVAVIGGLLFVLLQIRLFNAVHPTTPISAKYMPAFWIAISVAGISILCGLIVYGILIQSTPQLFMHEFDPMKRFTAQDLSPAPINLLTSVSLLQFISFGASIIAGVVFVANNQWIEPKIPEKSGPETTGGSKNQ